MRLVTRASISAWLGSFFICATSFALTAEQCQYFADGDRVTICHRTGSARSPYRPLEVTEEACKAHARHSGDYIAADDPTCDGGGCLPEGAPCDGTVSCCDGFRCENGACIPSPVPIPVAQIDPAMAVLEGAMPEPHADAGPSTRHAPRLRAFVLHESACP